jgi:hypothetical protein
MSNLGQLKDTLIKREAKLSKQIKKKEGEKIKLQKSERKLLEQHV